MINLSFDNTEISGPHIFTTTYARTALVLALKAIPVKGKEVLLPAFTCPVAVIGAVLEAGGIPIFVDIEIESLNFDIDDLVKKITKKSVALISHHYFGMVNRKVAINQTIAANNDLVHIEDCAHAMGAQCGRDAIGMNCDMAVFSFSKSLICPGGGILKCNVGGSLMEKLSTIYEDCQNDLVTGLLINMELFHFMYQLAIIHKYIERPSRPVNTKFFLHFLPYLWHVPSKLIKIVTGTTYYHGSFYQQGQRDNHPEFDFRMTHLQRRIINRMLPNLHKQIAKRRAVAERLSKIIPTLYPEDDNFFTYPCFILCTDDKSLLLSRAQDSGIHLNQTWPCEGRYTRTQKTDNIQWIEDHLLLLPISFFLSNYDIEQLEQFLWRNKDLIRSSLS